MTPSPRRSRAATRRSAGNQSKSKLDQAATSSATGGGLTVIGQDAHIGSWGGAFADSGFNSGDGTVSGNADAWGNRSDQLDRPDGPGRTTRAAVTRIVTQEARVRNLGLALAETGQNMGDMITTGNASAGGNQSQTGTTQDGLITGDIDRQRHRRPGLAHPQPRPGVRQHGFNQTTGDGSTNDAKVFQNGVLVEEDPEP